MKKILKFVAGVFRAFVLFAFVTLSFYIALVAFTSGYEYRMVDEHVKRAWHVKLPGYTTYLDIDTKPPKYRQRFTMRAYYRISPWIDPEWREDEETNERL